MSWYEKINVLNVQHASLKCSSKCNKHIKKCICIATSSDPHFLHFLMHWRMPNHQNQNHNKKRIANHKHTFSFGSCFLGGASSKGFSRWFLSSKAVHAHDAFHPRRHCPGDSLQWRKIGGTLLEVLHWKRVLLIKGLQKKLDCLMMFSSVAYLFLSYLWMHVSIETLH